MALATTPQPNTLAKCGFRDGAAGNYWLQPFESSSVKHQQDVLENFGIRGARSKEEAMSVAGPTHNAGSLSFVPNRLQLEDWLPFITGSAEAVDVYALAEAPKATLGFAHWWGTGGRSFDGGTVTKTTLKGSSGGLLSIDLDLIFKSSADLATVFTHETLDPGLPYAYSGLVYTFNSIAYPVKEFEFIIDHHIGDDHRNNSVDLQELYASGDREVLLNFTLADSAWNEDINQYVMKQTAGELIDYAATLVCTAPDSHTLTITAGRHLLTDLDSSTSGKDGEHEYKYQSRFLGSTAHNDECTITVANAV